MLVCAKLCAARCAHMLVCMRVRVYVYVCECVCVYVCMYDYHIAVSVKTLAPFER